MNTDNLPNEPIDKLKFYAYKDSAFENQDIASTFEVQFNPSEWGYSYRLEYNEERPQNATNSQKNFKRATPTGLNLSFIIDGTGAAGTEYIDLDVKQKIDDFFKVAIDYSGDKHRPRYIMLIWGKMIFKGVAQSVNIKYNLFTPDGKPLRAKVDLTLSSALSYEKQVAENAPESADMTHVRSITDGDNIPLMTYDIYNDPSGYIKVARFNKLVNFRRLQTGQNISFPPLLEKEESN